MSSVIVGIAFRYERGRLRVWVKQSGSRLPTIAANSRSSLESQARRLLEREGILVSYLEQLFSFSRSELDAKAADFTTVYFALAPPETAAGRNGTWRDKDDVSDLSRAERVMLSRALERLRSKVRYQPLGFSLLPRKFTLSQLQGLYESTLGQSLDKRNFRKKVQSLSLIHPLEERETGVSHRAARLYRYNAKAGAELTSGARIGPHG